MRFRFDLAVLAILAPTTGAFTSHKQNSITRVSAAHSIGSSFATTSLSVKNSVLKMSNDSVDAQAEIDGALAAGGVTLFGKSACPFCIKTKKALFGIGVHPTIVELDVVDGGAKIQKKLEDLTGKATVPNVWLDGKFIGGSEEVLAGVTDGMFDAVEKKEIIVMEEAEKIPVKQGENALKVGDKVPSAKVWSVFDNDPATYIDLADYGKDKTILVVGLPGAFTPTWSGQQVPAYLEYKDKLKEAGIDSVIVYCVNDPAVMMAWAKDQGVENWEITNTDGFVSFVSDPTSDFTGACGMEMTHEGPVGVGLLKRCKRFAFVATNGDVKVVNVSEYEGDPAGDDYPDFTLPPAMIEAIKKA